MEFGLGSANVPGLANPQVDEPRQPVLDHHPQRTILGVTRTSLQRPCLLQQALTGMHSHRSAYAGTVVVYWESNG